MEIRPLNANETDLLGEALLRSARWREQEPTVSLAEVAKDHPPILRYFEEFGKPGDRALATFTSDDKPMGVAWFRLFTEDRPGYGFVDDQTPELGLAVWPSHRGKGVGRMLLQALVAQARTDGFKAICLSVSAENERAQGLYQSEGFTIVRQEGLAITMISMLLRV